MPNRNRLNNKQTIKKNMVDEVDVNFTDYHDIYITDSIISAKITSFGTKMTNLELAIIKKIHDSSGERPEKEVKKEFLANLLSFKGRRASVYFKDNGLLAIRDFIRKDPSVLFEMKDADLIAFAGDFKTNLHPFIGVLGPYGYDALVETSVTNATSSFATAKPEPVSAQQHKDEGGDEVDTIILEILDILEDLDDLIPDTYNTVNPDLMKDYVKKRVEHTVGVRHNILGIQMRKKPALTPLTDGILTIRDQDGNVIKLLRMDLLGGGIVPSIRLKEYIATASAPGCIDKVLIFKPNYRDTLDMGFDLDPSV